MDESFNRKSNPNGLYNMERKEEIQKDSPIREIKEIQTDKGCKISMKFKRIECQNSRGKIQLEQKGFSKCKDNPLSGYEIWNGEKPN